VIGLAKKKEEIFLPGREDPLVLQEASPPLLVLQAVRNESHRFATTLHKKKRAKRVNMALLESIPGIGERRSRRLMEIFGSVEAILALNPEDIASKAGLSIALATELSAKLKSKIADRERS